MGEESGRCCGGRPCWAPPRAAATAAWGAAAAAREQARVSGGGGLVAPESPCDISYNASYYCFAGVLNVKYGTQYESANKFNCDLE